MLNHNSCVEISRISLLFLKKLLFFGKFLCVFPFSGRYFDRGSILLRPRARERIETEFIPRGKEGKHFWEIGMPGRSVSSFFSFFGGRRLFYGPRTLLKGLVQEEYERNRKISHPNMVKKGGGAKVHIKGWGKSRTFDFGLFFTFWTFGLRKK